MRYQKKTFFLIIIAGLLLGLLNMVWVVWPQYNTILAPIEFDAARRQDSAFTPLAGLWVEVSPQSAGGLLVRGQGAESIVSVALPQSGAYRLALVLTHWPGESNQPIRVFINDALVGQLDLPAHPEAQSFALAVPAAVAWKGNNTLRLVYLGVATGSQAPNNIIFQAIKFQPVLTARHLVWLAAVAGLAVAGQVGVIVGGVLLWRNRRQTSNRLKKQLEAPRAVAGRLGALTFGLVMALVAAELVLRFILPAQSGAMSGDANPWLQYVGWAGNPHQVRVNATFKTVIRYNSKGLRDVERSYEKPPDTFRILVLGDSFVEAEQISDPDKLFPRLLENLLNQQYAAGDLRFEVIAAGFSGWGTDQHLLYYQYEGYKYRPDLILVSFTSNDVADSYLPWRVKQTGWPEGCIYKPYFELKDDELVLRNFPYNRFEVKTPEEQHLAQAAGFFSGWQSNLYHQLRTYRLAVDAVKNNFPGADALLTGAGIIPTLVEKKAGRCQAAYKPYGNPLINSYVYRVDYSAEEEAAWALEKALIRELKVQTRRHHTPLAIVSNGQSSSTAYTRAGRPISTDNEGRQWDWEKVDRLLAKICRQEDIPFLALDPIFIASSYGFDELFVPDDGHYNLGGHQLAAGSIYNWLAEQSLVP